MRNSSVVQAIEATLDREKSHLTAQAVYEHIRGQLPAVNPSTVYRALERLAEAGEISVSDLGTGAAVIKAVTEVDARMEEVRVPLLIFHGTSDRLAAVDGSKRLYSRASSADKTLRLCEGLFHEVFNEPEREALLDELVKWLDGHTDNPGPTR